MTSFMGYPSLFFRKHFFHIFMNFKNIEVNSNVGNLWYKNFLISAMCFKSPGLSNPKKNNCLFASICAFVLYHENGKNAIISWVLKISCCLLCLACLHSFLISQVVSNELFAKRIWREAGLDVRYFFYKHYCTEWNLKLRSTKHRI